jgi:hypothetical protein
MRSPAGRLLEDRLATLSDDLDALFAESREGARRESAEQLNQAVRRLRAAPDTAGLCRTLEDAAVQFAEGALLFRVAEGVARHERIEVALSAAAAFAGAVQSKEPQTAATAAAEVSPSLVELLGHAPGGRASLFPVEAGDRVPALIYAWGPAQAAAIELLAQVAGAVWNAMEPSPAPAPAPPAGLVTIAPVTIAPAPAAPARPTWESLPPDEQQIHLRAQRFARVQAAEMRLYETDAVKSGRARSDLYNALRKPIDEAREKFRERFFARCPSMVDYLHLELTRTLAHDDPDLFGKEYPGPLV